MTQKKLSLGECIYISVKPIIRVYLILATGFILSKNGLLSPQMTKDVSSLVVNALLPCLSFNKIVTYISYKDLQMIGIIIVTSLFIYALGLLGGTGVYFGFKTNPKFFYGLLFCSSCTNISDLTISIMQSDGLSAIFSQEELGKGVSYAVIFLAVQNFMLMNLGLMTVPYYDVKNDLEELEKQAEVDSVMEKGALPSTGNKEESHEVLDKKYLEDKDDEDSPDHSDSALSNEDLSSLRSSIDSAELEEIVSQSRNRGLSIASALTKTLTGRSTHTNITHTLSNTNPDNKLVREFSIVSKVKTGDVDLHKPLSLYTDIPTENDPKSVKVVSGGSENAKFSFSEWCYSHKLGWLYYIIINFQRPVSIGTVLGLLCALVPWLKILFVYEEGYHIHQGPDKAPVLSVFMDFTAYIAQASVPLALLLLGGTIAKIDLKSLDFKFLKAAFALNLYRLCVMPIIGIAYVNRLTAIGWVDTPIQRLSLAITFAVPSATACIYFTALFTPVTGPQVQMACLGCVYVVAYLMFFITLSVFMTYFIKKDLGY